MLTCDGRLRSSHEMMSEHILKRLSINLIGLSRSTWIHKPGPSSPGRRGVSKVNQDHRFRLIQLISQRLKFSQQCSRTWLIFHCHGKSSCHHWGLTINAEGEESEGEGGEDFIYRPNPARGWGFNQWIIRAETASSLVTWLLQTRHHHGKKLYLYKLTE